MNSRMEHNYTDVEVPLSAVVPHGFIKDLDDGEMVFIRERSLVSFRGKHSQDAVSFALLIGDTVPDQDDKEHVGTLLRLNRGVGNSAINGYFVDFSHVNLSDAEVPFVGADQPPRGTEHFDPVPPSAVAYRDAQTGEIVEKYAPNAGQFKTEMEKLREFTNSHVFAHEHPHIAGAEQFVHSIDWNAPREEWLKFAAKYGNEFLKVDKLIKGVLRAITHAL